MAYGERGRRPPVVDLADRRALEAYRPADQGVVEEARRLKEAALLDFGLTQSAVASWLYAKCHHQIPTTAIDTAAVVASGDGTCLLLFNPDFFVGLGLDGVKFVLFHEARHLVHRHLFADPELHDDPVFELAAEVSINHVALVRLGRRELPLLDGRPTGIDPREVYEHYRADLTAHGLEPVPYETFTETDLRVYGELKRMHRPPVPERRLCVRLADGAPVPADQETVDAVTSSALLNSLLAARRGHAGAERELLDLMDRTQDGNARAARIWGNLGAGMLRGETTRTRTVHWWQRWLVDVLGSRLRDGERLVYPKKRGALLAALGQDPMLARRGPVRDKVLVVAYDTSGSMPHHVITWLTELVGGIDGVQAHWLSFDAVVMPFVPGERVYGGGGTSFQVVADYVEGRTEVNGRRFDETPDAVVVLTDGYAPAITPAEPDRWIWLITEGGDEWPERYTPAMDCHRVTTGSR
ncbi:vWA domain-containing protein [Streptomyces sp. NPDC002817]|uniref:vWA domain-containing protein n=1 Tax=Streptomyces sp. NPDC088357 TaxID=3154655 RepID=UPI003413B9BF